MSSKLIAYVTHPVGPNVGRDYIKRRDNLANVIEWVVFLRSQTNWAITVPWYLYIVASDDDAFTKRDLDDQLAIQRASQLLVVVGGEVTRHMHEDIANARAWNQKVADLTTLGRTPPKMTPKLVALMSAILNAAEVPL